MLPSAQLVYRYLSLSLFPSLSSVLGRIHMVHALYKMVEFDRKMAAASTTIWNESWLKIFEHRFHY